MSGGGVGRKRGLGALILTVLILTAFLTLFGKSMIDARLHQMERSLEVQSRQQIRDRTFLISSKITLLKRRMSRLRENKQDFVDEYKAQRLAHIDGRSLKAYKDTRNALIRPVIRFIRALMGKPAINAGVTASRDITLEQAYDRELKRDYRNAVSLFRKVLDSGKYRDTLMEDYIRLHIGFCLTMDGLFAESRKQYARLLEKGRKTELRSLALKLMDFSILSESRINSLSGKESLLDSAEEHLRFHNVREALRLVMRHLKTKKTERDRALYIKGRCHEETGKIQPAILAYSDVLLLNLNTYWSKMANRRLYLIGQIYHRNPRIREIAMKNSRERFKEDDLFKRVASILREDPKQDTRKPLDAAMRDRFKKIEKKASPPKQLRVIPAAYRSQVTILAKQYTLIHIVSMKNGMKLVGSILGRTGKELTLATVTGVHRLPAPEVVGIQLLYRK